MEYKEESELAPDFNKLRPSTITGERVVSVVLANPHEHKAGRTYNLDIPRLENNECLIPGSFSLLFKLEQSNDKAVFVNNIAKAIIQEMVVKFGIKILDCNRFNLLSVYEDLWLSKSERASMLEQGIGTVNQRTLMSTATAAGTNTGTDKLIYETYGNEIRLFVGEILKDHGVFAPSRLKGAWRYELRFADAKDVLFSSDNSAVDFDVKDIRMEYQVIRNQELADISESEYQTGKKLAFVDKHFVKTQSLAKAAREVNISISQARTSLKAVVIFFTDPARTDSEEYIFPNITSVSMTIKGRSNYLFSEGMPRRRLWDEARRLYKPQYGHDESMSIEDFYQTKFALVIDLRTEAGDGTNDGEEIIDNPNSLNIAIKKEATAKDLEYSVFLLSDAYASFANGALRMVEI